MEKELVSVIIACYNAEKYIDECIESLLAQTYQNIEIVICDDASTDNSYQLLKEWQKKDTRIRLIQNSQNMHSAASRNACLDIAKGKYILIQDIDDVSVPNRLEILLNNLVANNVDFVSSSMATIDDNGNVDFQKLLKHKKFPTKYDFLWGISFNHPATLFLKSILLQVNGYTVSEVTSISEDYDLYMRLYAFGAKGMNLDKPLYLYRTNAANYKMHNFSYRIKECKIRYKGFKQLNILFIGFPMVIKPLFVLVVKKYFRIGKRL